VKSCHAGAGIDRQRGVVLIITLILLVVMTLVGISTMKGSILEIKMAGAMQEEEVALRRAERTLISAEKAVLDLVSTAGPFEFTLANDGYYLVTTDDLDASVSDWSAISSLEGPITSDNGLDDDDAFVIEYLGVKPVPGERLGVRTDAPIAGDEAHFYRNTTRSASGRNAVRIVESIYATSELP
jgi:type IV pilus assembly protein PilX